MDRCEVLPDKIDILGIQYDIEEVEAVSKDQLLYGQIQFFEGKILIDATMSDDKKKQTLIHEAIHGICDGLALEELNNNESAIQGLASAIYSTFKGTTIFS